MSLYHKYRPQTLEDVYGNKETIQTLDAVLSREDVPHAFLLTGPTGTGKTTVARIIANRIGCIGSSFQEINAADFRGIDTIRDIRQASTYQPLEGDCRVWLIDECFAKGTLVSLSQGESIPIEQIKAGMIVANLQGEASVLHTRENKVSLDRVVKVVFSDNREIICSKEHMFLTNSGWKSAIDLNNTDLTFLRTGNGRKNEVYKKNEWNITYLERRKRWKRAFNRTASFIIRCFRMAYGNSNSYGVLPRQRRLPSKLQSRYRKCCSQISDRSGWKGSQFERRTLERQEERGQIETVRVASVTIYQRGSNDESFRGIINDQEKDQGYVIFYDLEIEGHPSYFANGVLVHNCHVLTSVAQNALLKLLEDPPKHVYLILATTDPQNLLATIKGRCATFEMGILTDKEMYKLLRKVVIEEKAVIEKEVYDQIIQDSLGHPRNALQILDSVLAVEPEMQLSVAKKSAELQSKAIELCRVLTNPNASWKKVSTILLGLKDEQAETIRRAILGYCQAILLKNANDHVAFVMEQFLEPFYNTGFPGLTYACYYVVKGEN